VDGYSMNMRLARWSYNEIRNMARWGNKRANALLLLDDDAYNQILGRSSTPKSVMGKSSIHLKAAKVDTVLNVINS